MLKINSFRNIYNQRQASKNAIRKILGEDIVICRNYDIGSFQGVAEIFGKTRKLYQSASKQNNSIDRNSINYIGCFYNNERELENIYVFNRKDKNIDVFTRTGELVQQYTPEEVEALFTYKHDSGNVHRFLRKTKNIKKEKIEKVKKIVELISSLFKNDKNVSKTTEEKITYRALDKSSLNKILSLEEGEIFTDPSFTSVATKQSKILQFLGLRNFLHPVKIKLPKGTKYISLDELHNIIMPCGRETEFLLQEGNNYLITKKPKFGFIEMELIPKQTNV